MHTMLIRPTKQQFADFGKPDLVIYNAGAFPANSLTAGMGSKTSVDLSLKDHELVILGTEYAGEMKKDRLVEEVKGIGGKILMTSLSHQDEARLQAALSAAKSAGP